MILSAPGFDAAGLLVLSAVIAVVTVLSFLAFVVAAGRDRAEGPEPRGQAVYVHLVLLVSLFTGLVAATTVVAALSQLIGTNSGSPSPVIPVGPTGSSPFSGFTGVTGVPIGSGAFGPAFGLRSLHPVGDAAARGGVAGGIVLLVASALFLTHWRRGRVFREDPVLRMTNPGRVLQAYLNTATFVAVLILIVVASLAGYAIFEAAAPGVAQSGGRVASLRGLIPLLFFVAGTLVIIDWHWRRLRPLRGAPVAPTPTAPTG